MLKKILTNFLSLIYALFKINWFKVVKLHSRKADNIIWICPIFPRRFIEYMLRATFINDLSIVSQFLKEDKPFRIFLGKKIGKFSEKNIFYSISYHFNPYHLLDHAIDVQNIVRGLEGQSNNMYPPYKEVMFWENKKYMHEQFTALDLNQPATEILDLRNVDINALEAKKYPVLWKEVNSAGSLGLFKLNNKQELHTLANKKKKEGETVFLLQDIIDMRSDLRVTLVDDKVEHFYWRKNPSDEWKPTSTKHGSSTVFGDFPEQWREEIIASFRKLDITTGAFDITWDKDDLTTKPIILEISPSYDLNPPPPESAKAISYKQYKSKFFSRDPYFKGRVDVFFDVKGKVARSYMKQANVIQ